MRLEKSGNLANQYMLLQVPPNSTESLGVMVLKARGVSPEASWYWIGVVALIGFFVMFNFLYTLALQHLERKQPLSPFIFLGIEGIKVLTIKSNHAALDTPQAVLSKDSLAMKHAVKTGESIELSATRKNSTGGFIIQAHFMFVSTLWMSRVTQVSMV